MQDAVIGTDGPIHASFPEEVDDPIPSAWVDTLSALGYPASGDPFSGEFTGGYINAMSIDPETRTRSDAATAYFKPAKDRPNLHVITNSLAEKVIFDTSGDLPRAIAVQLQHNGKSSILKANKEIILSAGVFGTPKLLELSGIGGKTLLQKYNIPVIVDNPNVGENLQDHPNAGVSFEVVDGIKTLDGLSRQEPEAIGAAMQEYIANKKGPFAVGGNFAGAMLPVPDFVDGPDASGTLRQILDATKDAMIAEDFSSLHQEFIHSILEKRSEGVGNFFTYAACGSRLSLLYQL